MQAATLQTVTEEGETGAPQGRLAFLLHATTELLAAPQSIDAVLATVARLAVPELGDFCVVDGSDGGRALQKRAARPGAARLASADAPALRARLVVPIALGARTFGALSLASYDRAYHDADRALAEELAYRAALALDRAARYADARAAAALRDEILATVAHDLGSPLATISLSIERALLSLRERESPIVPMLERCQRAARSIATLARDLLDAATLDVGKLPISAAPIEVECLIAEVVDQMHPLAESRGLTLTHARGAALPLASCDRARIAQVLSNLVGNAIKFTPAGGSIHLSAECLGAHVRVRVRDDGPGIAPELNPHLFERYYHRSTTENAAGTGLGLYIAKGIIEKHGGQIWVDSAPGGGSSFYFTLPVAASSKIIR